MGKVLLNNRGAVVLKCLKWSLIAGLIALGWFVIPGMLEAGAWVLSGSRWTDRDEKVYQDFVQAVGESGYGNLNKFIRDPRSNPLYGEEDKKFNLSPDCADLPYLLRAYVAYKLRLPYSYVCDISGGGGDQRYSKKNRPTETKDQDNYASPQNLFNYVVLVNSGYYRMAPDVQDGDTYPVKIQKSSIIPGTVYYDPNGHVAVVYQVTSDGRIRMMDAHPDKSISRPWFGSKFAIGGASQGGGFRRWRPLWYSSDGQTHRLNNVNVPDYSATDQYQDDFQINGLNNLSYFDYVRFRLSDKGGKIDPVDDFRQMISEIFEDIKYRVEAVDICIQDGIHSKEHPGNLPYNIYGTDGEWEKYSTPSRDARLKVAFLDLYTRTMQLIAMAERGDPNLQFSGSADQLASQLLAIFDSMSPSLIVSYKNSAGAEVSMNFHEVMKRLFLMSFDPYHSVEYRWGATGSELSSSKDGPLKQQMYQRESRLRNQLERLYNCPTGFSLGPEKPADVDVRTWLVNYLGGKSRPQIVASAMNSSSSDDSPKETIVPSLPATQLPRVEPVKILAKPIRQMVKTPEAQMWKFADGVFSKMDHVAVQLIAWNLSTISKK